MKRNAVIMDVSIGIALMLFSALIVLMSKSFPSAVKRFPLLVAGLLFSLAACLTVSAAVQYFRRAEKRPYFKWKYSKYPLIGLLLLLVYYVLMQWITFFPATTLFLIVAMLYLRVRSWKTILSVTVVVDALVWLVFVKQLSIYLP